MHYQTPMIRDTFKYVADCSHLDQWHEASWQYRTLSHRTHYDCDLEDSQVIYNRIKVKSHRQLSCDAVFEALRGEYAMGCHCEHDCCGHFFGNLYEVIKPTNRKRNEFIAIAHYSRNY